MAIIGDPDLIAVAIPQRQIELTVQTAHEVDPLSLVLAETPCGGVAPRGKAVQPSVQYDAMNSGDRARANGVIENAVVYASERSTDGFSMFDVVPGLVHQDSRHAFQRTVSRAFGAFT
jgi:hypothetical protein